MQAHNHSLDFQGHQRSYFLKTVAAPRLAVLLLHPTASSGKAMAAGGGWLKLDDVAILAPDGLPRVPDMERAEANPRCWSSEEEPARGRPVDDLAFIDHLLPEFLSSLPDGTPLVLVGHSNGCAMGFRVLAESMFGSRFAAACLYAASWAGRKADLDMPVLYMTGDSDPIRPFHGNVDVVTPWFSLRATPVMDTVNDCLERLAALPAAPMVDPRPEFTALRWESGRAPFEFRILRGQGHHWPAGEPLDPRIQQVIGPNNLAIDATAMAIEFVQKHVRAAA